MGLFLGIPTSELLSITLRNLRLPIFLQCDIRAHISWREEISFYYQFLGDLDGWVKYYALLSVVRNQFGGSQSLWLWLLLIVSNSFSVTWKITALVNHYWLCMLLVKLITDLVSYKKIAVINPEGAGSNTWAPGGWVSHAAISLQQNQQNIGSS